MTDENTPDNISAKTLWIIAETEVTEEKITEEKVETEGRRSGGGDRGGGFALPRRVFESEQTVVKRDRVPIPAEKVKAQMQSLVAIVNDLFEELGSRTGLQLDEVQLSVEINAEGNVSLLGSGGKVGSKGGMTLKFVRSPK